MNATSDAQREDQRPQVDVHQSGIGDFLAAGGFNGQEVGTRVGGHREHDIGKNLVAAKFEGGGFEVFDLGVNVTTEKFIETVKAIRQTSSPYLRC